MTVKQKKRKRIPATRRKIRVDFSRTFKSKSGRCYPAFTRRVAGTRYPGVSEKSLYDAYWDDPENSELFDAAVRQ